MTGIYTVFVTNGAHIAVLLGGYLGQKAGWQWDFYLPAIVVSFSFLVALFCLPETLFSRDPEFLATRTKERTYRDLLFKPLTSLIPGRKLRGMDFLTSLYMLKYPSVALVFWFYTWSWTFINILPALAMAKIYLTEYGFKSGPIGLCTGIPLTIGSVIGELSAGKLSDIIMYRLAKRNNGVRKPEHRLYLTCLSAFLGPIGMIVFGTLLNKHAYYILPLIGLGIGKSGPICTHDSITDGLGSRCMWSTDHIYVSLRLPLRLLPSANSGNGSFDELLTRYLICDWVFLVPDGPSNWICLDMDHTRTYTTVILAADSGSDEIWSAMEGEIGPTNVSSIHLEMRIDGGAAALDFFF